LAAASAANGMPELGFQVRGFRALNEGHQVARRRVCHQEGEAVGAGQPTWVPPRRVPPHALGMYPDILIGTAISALAVPACVSVCVLPALLSSLVLVRQAAHGVGRGVCCRGSRHHSHHSRCPAGVGCWRWIGAKDPPGCLPRAQERAARVLGAHRRVLEACAAQPVDGLADRGGGRCCKAERGQQGWSRVASSGAPFAPDGKFLVPSLPHACRPTALTPRPCRLGRRRGTIARTRSES
jgi:hypothetical protein